MARTINEIYNQILDSKSDYSELDELNSTSQTSIYRLLFYIQAVAINLFEQVLDVFKQDIEVSIVNSVSGTERWIKNNVFKFQYSSVNPQVLEISDDYTISYPSTDTNLQIVEQCSIETLDNFGVIVKVAKGEPLEPLAALEISSLESYLDKIMPAGIKTLVVSLPSDKVYIKGNIYFNGQYSGVIQSNVINAIDNYLNSLDFGGEILVSKLKTAILNVTGVNDINITRIQARKDSESFVYEGNTPVYILEGTVNDVNNIFYYTTSGYAETETESGYTIEDSLNFIAQ